MEQVVINGEAFEIRRDEDGRINMNDAHRASGGLPKKRPQLFLANKRARVLAEKVEESNAGIPALSSSVGGNHSGTYAHEDVFFAYCAWIDADFYAAVAQVFGHVARGELDKAVSTVRSVTRIDGIDKRKSFCSALGRCGAERADFGSMTDILNIAVFGKASANLKKDRGVKKSASLRDAMTEEELACIAAAEALTTMYLVMSKDKNRATMREGVYRGAEAFKSVAIQENNND